MIPRSLPPSTSIQASIGFKYPTMHMLPWTMTLTDLPVADFETIIGGFLPQTNEDMCYSAGLVNIINDLGHRSVNASLRFSLRQMNDICGYRAGAHCRDDMVPTWVSQTLEPIGYRYNQAQGDETDLDHMREITVDERSSYPLVNVSPTYFDTIRVRRCGAYQWDHILVVMGVDHEIIYFYDPYSSFYSRFPNIDGLPRHLTTPDFLRFWEEAWERRWVCWIEPLDTVQARLPGLEGP